MGIGEAVVPPTQSPTWSKQLRQGEDPAFGFLLEAAFPLLLSGF